MEAFFKEYLETIMMVAFLLAVFLGIYKVYVMFEKQSQEGLDIQTLEDEIISIIGQIFSQETPSEEELFFKIQEHELFGGGKYKNFNLNRYKQILNRLYLEYKVENYKSLKEKLC